MKEFDGSKGDWSYSKVTGTIRSDGGVVAELLINGSEDNNGVLMAAAPRLLEALQCLVQSYEDFRKKTVKDDRPQAYEIVKAKEVISEVLGK
ncbi:hypothetical protein SNN52_003747 [Cronobacter sakazakii]|uniref:hypothetical protein n=1 Tax=Cronobacter sakazakii TaxID=28141 RepID=UPI0004A8DD49|nr:hypothetical protein [Cronobacter sakazakii]ELY5808693.1 hypothetical protein [Cronobacter sakazakii]ELY5893857.1 hypothetical protein [Cronobacter sakazakii]KDP98949.1 hypothetical protein ER21_06425 [Cronobacter sakazakii]MDK1282694.1 hypothetical protein [Cronobacter sakazakii]UXD96281.1 hypothetical protein K1721_04270 [Cronobacter sakazakii]